MKVEATWLASPRTTILCTSPLVCTVCFRDSEAGAILSSFLSLQEGRVACWESASASALPLSSPVLWDEGVAFPELQVSII